MRSVISLSLMVVFPQLAWSQHADSSLLTGTRSVSP